MKRIPAISTAVLLAVLLASCGAGENPFSDYADEDDASSTPDTATDDGSAIDIGTTTNAGASLPGTATATAYAPIFRREAKQADGGQSPGAGYLEAISIRDDGAGNTIFEVDGLPFDGDNTYALNTAFGVGDNGTPTAAFQIFEGAATSTDPVTGTVNANDNYRAVYGRSTSGNTEFAIVRDRDFFGYGFGGFVYQRNNTFTFPTCSGACTATFSGAYGGIRVFTGRTGIEYVSGDAEVIIDFEDFNGKKPGAKVWVYNRRLYDESGTDITGAYMTALEGVDSTSGLIDDTSLPTVRPVISEDTFDANGEFGNSVQAVAFNDDGTSTVTQSGTYYAMVSGEGADMEVVGVMVMTETDPRFTGVSTMETGGFILYRN